MSMTPHELEEERQYQEFVGLHAIHNLDITGDKPYCSDCGVQL